MRFSPGELGSLGESSRLYSGVAKLCSESACKLSSRFCIECLDLHSSELSSKANI